MKLTIFGATSATGKLLLEKALAVRHEVTAFMRDESKLGVGHERLKAICGDALNALQV